MAIIGDGDPVIRGQLRIFAWACPFAAGDQQNRVEVLIIDSNPLDAYSSRGLNAPEEINPVETRVATAAVFQGYSHDN